MLSNNNQSIVEFTVSCLLICFDFFAPGVILRIIERNGIKENKKPGGSFIYERISARNIPAIFFTQIHANGTKCCSYLRTLARSRIQPSLQIDSVYKATETVPESIEFPNVGLKVPPKKYETLLGNLFAGQYEFPWLVDIRVYGLWKLDAVGNLVTAYHVLTTCRTIFLYEKYLPTSQGTQISYYEGPGSMRISFASTYIYEINRAIILYSGPIYDKQMVGERVPAWVLKHTGCDRARNFREDVALIGLSRPIDLMPPYVAFAPIWRSPVTGTIPDMVGQEWVDLTTNEICWVAAWGRNYSNVGRPITLNHKVKIRVYAFRNLTACLHIWSNLCLEKFPDYESCKNNIPNEVTRHGLICLETRSPVGAVCDTNKGAPIVCGSQVYGMVMRAFPIEKCSSIDPQPFLVVNLHGLETGNPKIYGGTLIETNKDGAAPHFYDDNIILYTKNGGLDRTRVTGLPALMIFLLSMALRDQHYVE